MAKKIDKFEKIKAWCSGKGYNKPTDFNVSKARSGYYYLDIYTGGVYLAKFTLKTKEELLKGVEIVLQNLKH